MGDASKLFSRLCENFVSQKQENQVFTILLINKLNYIYN